MEGSPNRPHLKRALGLYATTAIVVASVVGSGIFSSPPRMAQTLPSAGILLAVWVFTGGLTLFGALTQCELVGQMPKTGGLYEYFHEVYGEGVGFLYGWANFTIAASGGIAAISFFSMSYLDELVHLPHLAKALEDQPFSIPLLGNIFPLRDLGTKGMASIMIIGLTWMNVRGVKLSGFVQSISTTSKIVALLGVVAVAFLFGSHIGTTEHWTTHALSSQLAGWGLIGAISMTMSQAFWAYNGWGNVAFLAGEVKDPSRTLPRAIILGTLIFIGLYLVINFAYFYILPIDDVAKAPGGHVATDMIMRVVGPWGATLIAILIIFSTIDATNSGILTKARVYYAMADNKLFYSKAAAVHPKYQTPYVALILQGVWAIVLLVSGSFNLITDMLVWVNWVLFALMGLAVFVLRVRSPNRDRPFRVPGYPFVPAIFVLFATAYVVITLITDIQAYHAGTQPIVKSVTGLVLVLTGLPFYYFWRAKKNGRREA